MHKIIGVICLVVGIVLLCWGYQISQSIGGRLAQAFTGSPTDKSMALYLSGGALALVGLFSIFNSSK